MRMIKTTLVAGLISIFATFSSFAEKVKIGDPGWTGATAIAVSYTHLTLPTILLV